MDRNTLDQLNNTLINPAGPDGLISAQAHREMNKAIADYSEEYAVQVSQSSYLGLIYPTDTPPLIGAWFGKAAYAGTFTGWVDAANNPIVVTVDDLEIINGAANNRVILEVNNGVATMRKERVKGSANPVFDADNNTDAATMKATFDYLEDVEIISVSYRFFDDFSTNKGWFADPDFPATFTIGGGVLSIPLTAGTNEGVRVALPAPYSPAEVLKFTLRYRIVGGTAGSRFAAGESWGPGTTAQYTELTPTSTWQESTFESSGLSSNLLMIGVHSSGNAGGTLEIDLIEVDKKISAPKNYDDVLGDANYIDLISSIGAGGTVFLKPATYILTEPLNIPNNTSLYFVKGRTKVIYTGVGTAITIDSTKENIAIKYLEMEGNALITPTTMDPEDIKTRAGIGTVNGIVITGNPKNIDIEDNEIYNFSGVGMKLANAPAGSYINTVKVTGNKVHHCYMGILFDTRAEYHQFTTNQTGYCMIGQWVEGGNVTGTLNNSIANGVGIVISGINGDNDTHGSISTSLYNHNLSYSVFAINVNNSFSLTGCQAFEGDIYVEDSFGFSFASGTIDAKIYIIENEINGFGLNSFHGNKFDTAYGGGTIIASHTDIVGTVTNTYTKLSLALNSYKTGNAPTGLNNNIL